MSKEIVLATSAAEIEDELRVQALDRISAVVIQKREAEYQKKIDDHYTARAKKLMESIWENCRKRTYHQIEAATNSDTGSREMICVTCLAPMMKDQYGHWEIDRARARAGFGRLGEKLRAADKQADIEWIPGT